MCRSISVVRHYRDIGKAHHRHSYPLPTKTMTATATTMATTSKHSNAHTHTRRPVFVWIIVGIYGVLLAGASISMIERMAGNGGWEWEAARAGVAGWTARKKEKCYSLDIWQMQADGWHRSCAEKWPKLLDIAFQVKTRDIYQQVYGQHFICVECANTLHSCSCPYTQPDKQILGHSACGTSRQRTQHFSRTQS